MESLSQYCRRRNIPKGSAHRYLSDLGFDLSQGLSAAAIAALEEKWEKKLAVVEVLGETPGTASAGALSIPDPFAGVGAGGWSPLSTLTVVNRSGAAGAIANDTAALIAAAAVANNQTVVAAAGAADQLGDQLGAMLAQRTISAAERRRQELLTDYLEAQGVQVGKSDGPAAA